MYAVVLALQLLKSATSSSGHQLPSAIFAAPESYSFTMVDTPLYHYYVYAPAFTSSPESHPTFFNNPSPMPSMLDNLFNPYTQFATEGSVDMPFRHLGSPVLENTFYPSDFDFKTQVIPAPSVYRKTQTIPLLVPKTNFYQNSYAPAFRPNLTPPEPHYSVPTVASPSDSPSYFPNIIREEAEGGTFPLNIFQGNTYSSSPRLNSDTPSYKDETPLPFPAVLSSSTPNIIRGEAQSSLPQNLFYPFTSTQSPVNGFPLHGSAPTPTTPVEDASKALLFLSTFIPEDGEGLTTISPFFHPSESTTPTDHTPLPSNFLFQAPGHDQPRRR